VLDPQDILTPDQLAKRLSVSRSWVTEKCRTRGTNPMPHYRIGRYVRFSWPVVAEWIESTATASPKHRDRSPK
jgi:excisionase family DNA binding protein